MSQMRVDGEFECDVGVVVQESPEERRRRLNRERMRRNRSNPMYREREQRRQRERRRERLMASKIAKHVQKTTPPTIWTRSIRQGGMDIPRGGLPWPREMHEGPVCAAHSPCVVALPMGPYSGYSDFPVLPPAVALSMLSGVPSNMLLLVTDDAVQPQCPAIPVAPALEPSLCVKSPVHLSKNLNLDKAGNFWYTNEAPNHPTTCVNSDGPVIKREY